MLNRLKRLEGQVRGLQKMVEEERDCREILTLLSGVRSALEATGDIIFETYLEECQADLAKGQGDTRAIVEAVRLLRR
ncbi:Copper-sensing transcriptional repressor CsoR [Calidithermus roseus]|uniref:Copper-sensing transcriptional repressor CsoR n=1 Tax=Calidithermus roseus TaxID=1644118 RepID=A0A399EXU8_9DEIN|nr:Copper-sensing transcriptional repressor CsoR [Calidithermus roseus]